VTEVKFYSKIEHCIEMKRLPGYSENSIKMLIFLPAAYIVYHVEFSEKASIVPQVQFFDRASTIDRLYNSEQSAAVLGKVGRCLDADCRAELL